MKNYFFVGLVVAFVFFGLPQGGNAQDWTLYYPDSMVVLADSIHCAWGFADHYRWAPAEYPIYRMIVDSSDSTWSHIDEGSNAGGHQDGFLVGIPPGRHTLSIQAILGGFGMYSRVISTSQTWSFRVVLSTSLEGTKPLTPPGFGLGQNYPNPFNPETTISYSIPYSDRVDLTIYNIIGQKVTTLIDDKKLAGFHQVVWDATEFSAGIYFYRLQCGEFVETKKLILQK